MITYRRMHPKGDARQICLASLSHAHCSLPAAALELERSSSRSEWLNESTDLSWLLPCCAGSLGQHQPESTLCFLLRHERDLPIDVIHYQQSTIRTLFFQWLYLSLTKFSGRTNDSWLWYCSRAYRPIYNTDCHFQPISQPCCQPQITAQQGRCQQGLHVLYDPSLQ